MARKAVSQQSRVTIAGVAMDNVTMGEAIARIESMIRERSPCYVVTPNVDHVVKLQTNDRFRQVYESASLVLPDGMPLIWASRWLSTPLREKVSGSDLFPLFCEEAARKGYRLYFMGGRPGAVQGSAEVLARAYPGLNVVGADCPPMGFDRNEAENHRVIASIRDARPDILFVGLGSPKGELWIHSHHRECGVPVSIGIGASFDFVAGMVRRAPVFLQRIGMEWAWRLLLEPRRMYRRYLIDDPVFLRLVWRQKRVARGRRPPCERKEAGT